MPHADAVLRVQKLTKSYSGFSAVKGISFALKKGEILGLLGVNGAGKTTAIQMLLGITTPSRGTISYFGKNFAHHEQESLQKINFATAYGSLQGGITVYENLNVYAGLYSVKNPKKRIDKLVERLEIGAIVDQKFWSLSAGQKTRVILAKALINNPQIILMDEPTASLDPDIADKVLTFIEEIKKEHNVSILYTSHDMEEVARICNRVIFLNHGEIIAEDTPLGLTKRIKHALLTVTYDAKKTVIEDFVKEKELDASYPRKNIVSFKVEEEELPKIIFGLSKRNIWVTNIDITKPSLEDVFINISRSKEASL